MSELEFEIGRTLGASCFFIYQTIKANPNSSVRDLQIETGLSQNCVETSLSKLRDSKVIERDKTGAKAFIYRENKTKETWKFH